MDQIFKTSKTLILINGGDFDQSATHLQATTKTFVLLIHMHRISSIVNRRIYMYAYRDPFQLISVVSHILISS
jgi:hypothetical protein